MFIVTVLPQFPCHVTLLEVERRRSLVVIVVISFLPPVGGGFNLWGGEGGGRSRTHPKTY